MSSNKYPQIKRQAGISLFGFFIILSVCIFIGLFALKVAPLYAQNWTVNKVAEDLVSKPEVLQKSRSEVYKFIDMAYRQNNLWDLKPQDTIKLKRDKKVGYVVTVQYERRTNLFRNIDLVTSFENNVNGEP